MFKWITKIFQDNKDNGVSTENFDLETVPKHIAVIMDGNGRWAQKKDLARIKGHQNGVAALKQVVKVASELGVDFFTAYAFSTENWKRPQQEVEFLMDLFQKVFQEELATFKEENIKVNVIGYKDRLPESVKGAVDDLITATKNNTGLQLNIALDYGARSEIIESAKKIVDDVENNSLKLADLTEEKFSQYLYTSGQPDVDLLIRPGGEKRISNFLLWQIAYSELYFTDTYWPDFGETEFKSIIKEYQSRNRRFGAVEGK
ncbi:MAG: isoprenyl transferase [Bacillota bacterium]